MSRRRKNIIFICGHIFGQQTNNILVTYTFLLVSTDVTSARSRRGLPARPKTLNGQLTEDFTQRNMIGTSIFFKRVTQPNQNVIL